LNKVYIETLGCKVNQYESAAIMDTLVNMGFEIAEKDINADILILNSCTVTNRTDFKSRNIIRRFLKLKSESPEKIIIVSGCYLQREKEQAIALGDIDALVDNNSKSTIPSIVEQIISSKNTFNNKYQQAHDFVCFDELPSSSMGEKSRAFIKIQDGCNFYCSYCAIPYARGNPRSRDPESILQQVKEMMDNGYHEFVLAGINQGLYGMDFKVKHQYINSLADLIQAICDIPNNKKIRLSSVEPQLFTNELLRVLYNNDQVCPHFHIPLQSGSDNILKAMKRKYDTHLFQNLVNNLVQNKANTALGIDVIVGFPGETDELFEQTYQFLKALPITYLHVFIYSKRRNTVAANMPHQINGKIAKERSQKLIELSQKKLHEYINNLLNKKVELTCIVETCEDGYCYGMTDHFVRTKFFCKDQSIEKGSLISLNPIKAESDYILAEMK